MAPVVFPPIGALVAIHAAQRAADNLPCPSCGGDRLRGTYSRNGACHAPRTPNR